MLIVSLNCNLTIQSFLSLFLVLNKRGLLLLSFKPTLGSLLCVMYSPRSACPSFSCLTSLIQHYRKRNCTKCGCTPDDPAVCLVCGKFTCLQGTCCVDATGDTPNYECIQVCHVTHFKCPLVSLGAVLAFTIPHNPPPHPLPFAMLRSLKARLVRGRPDHFSIDWWERRVWNPKRR